MRMVYDVSAVAVCIARFTVASKFSCEALRHTAFSVLFSASS